MPKYQNCQCSIKCSQGLKKGRAGATIFYPFAVIFPALCLHTRRWEIGRWRWRSCWWGRLGPQCVLQGWVRHRGSVAILVVGSQSRPARHWRGRQLGHKCLYWSSWWANSSRWQLTNKKQHLRWQDRWLGLGPSGRLATARRESWRSAWKTRDWNTRGWNTRGWNTRGWNTGDWNTRGFLKHMVNAWPDSQGIKINGVQLRISYNQRQPKGEPFHPLSDVQPEVMDGNEADYEANDCDCGERKKNGELVKHAVQSLSSWSEVSFLISLDDTLWNSVCKFIVASMSFIHSDDKTSKLVHISEINLWRFWCILAEYNAWVLLETFNIESDDWAKAPIWT